MRIGIMLIVMVLWGVISPMPVSAQFQHLTIKQGLSQNTVYSIVQDKRGILYFGTQDGLNLYNGYGFQVIRHHADSHAHPSDNNILCMVRDHSGMIWIGTEGGGLNSFDPETGIFLHYRHDPENPGSMGGDFVTALCVDPIGSLWVGTRNGVLSRRSPSGSFEQVPYHDERAPHVSILSIAADKDGKIWLGTKHGLFRLDPLSKTKTLFQHTHGSSSLSANIVNCLMIDRRKRLWIGTSGGLDRFDPGTESFIHFRWQPDRSRSLSNKRVQALTQSGDGSIWIGTGGDGLVRLDPETGDCVRFPARRHRSDGLNDTDIYSLWEDHSGILWVGTSNHGINKLTPRTLSFHLMRNDPLNPSSLHNDIVWSIIEDRNKDLWVGTELGVDRWNPQRNQLSHYHLGAPRSRRLSGNLVRTLCEDSEGRIWIGSDDGGVDRIDTKGIIHRFHHRARDSASLSSNRILTIVQDRSQRIWIGTRDGGLNLWVPGNGFRVFRHDPEDPASLSNNSVYTVLQDSRGSLWVGTLSGLNRMRGDGTGFDHFRHDPKNPSSIPDDGVGIVFEDSSGTLWIGTDKGLCSLKPGESTFVQYSLDIHDNSGIVYAIVEDQFGKLWVSTNHGLFKCDPSSRNCLRFDVLDGLQSNEFNTSAAFRGKDGVLYFGGIDGLTYFHPEEITTNPHVPTLVLTGFRVFNRPLRLHRPSWAVRRIQLSHELNFFSLEFAALDFTSPTRNQYRYRLTGFDHGWVDAGHRRTAHYTNVPPGNYRFQVLGSNNDGVWNRVGMAVTISITPPLWLKPWFQLLCAIALLGIIFLFFRMRVRRIREQRNTLQREVEESTRQLREANKKLKRLARQDGLTGLLNQRQFQELLRKETRRSMRTGNSLSLIMIDVDHFKLYNDTYGHEAGNKCLKEIAKVLRRSSRRMADVAARYGGEEFAVLLPTTGQKGARLVADAVRHEVEALDMEHRASPVLPRVTVSLGVATAQPKNEEDGNLLVLDADKALYRAKREGRNRVRKGTGFHSPPESDIS